MACPNNSIKTIDQEYPLRAHIGVTQALLSARHPFPSADLSPLPPSSTPNALARDTLETIASRVSGPVALFFKKMGSPKRAGTASWWFARVNPRSPLNHLSCPFVPDYAGGLDILFGQLQEYFTVDFDLAGPKVVDSRRKS